jgi:hypothetical protein
LCSCVRPQKQQGGENDGLRWHDVHLGSI